MTTPTKLLENTRRWRRTQRGFLTNLYHKMRGRHPVKFSLEVMHQLGNERKFQRLFSEWVKSGYQTNMRPSLDRTDPRIGYTINNVKWMTWAENRFKQTTERRGISARPVYQMLGSKVVKKFHSQREAVMKTGISQGNMSTVLTGKRKTAGGYGWSYEVIGNVFSNPELISTP